MWTILLYVAVVHTGRMTRKRAVMCSAGSNHATETPQRHFVSVKDNTTIPHPHPIASTNRACGALLSGVGCGHHRRIYDEIRTEYLVWLERRGMPGAS